MTKTKKIMIFVIVFSFIGIFSSDKLKEILSRPETVAGRQNRAMIGMVLSGVPAIVALYQTYQSIKEIPEILKNKKIDNKGRNHFIIRVDHKALVNQFIKIVLSLGGLGISSFIFHYSLRQFINPEIYGDRWKSDWNT